MGKVEVVEGVGVRKAWKGASLVGIQHEHAQVEQDSSSDETETLTQDVIFALSVGLKQRHIAKPPEQVGQKLQTDSE